MQKTSNTSSRCICILMLTAGFATTVFAQTGFWEPVNGLLAGPVFALAVDRNEVIFAGTLLGVGRSTDNGDSWEINSPRILFDALAINNAGHVFAGTIGRGVYRSTDNGDSWSLSNTGLPPSRVFALAVNAGLPQVTVFTLSFDRQGRILAGTEGNGVFRSIGTTTSVDEDGGDTPLSFALAQNYPNPFNPSTTIAFDLDRPAPVKLKVFDVTGREVAVLADHVFQAGTHKIVFTPNGLADGVYFYRIEAGESVRTKKLTLLK